MGLLDRITGLAKRTLGGIREMFRGAPAPTRRRGIGEQVFSGSISGTSTFGWPGGWSQDRIEQVLHYKHWVFVAVRAISQEIAGLVPQLAYVSDHADAHNRGITSERALNDWKGRAQYIRSQHQVQAHESVDPLPPNHPLCRLLARPNEWDTSSDLWYELSLFLELTGNAYIWCPPSRYGALSGSGIPAELWVMPSHWVWPRLDRYGIKFYEIRPFVGPGVLHFPASEIIHFKDKSPLHKLDGWSAQTAGAEWIDTEEATQRALFWQMKNGCFPIGAITLGEAYADPDDADMERIYAKFFARIQGESNYGKPIIMPPGAEYNPLTIAPAEMAWGETGDRLRDKVLCLFGIPKEVCGVQDAGSEIAMYGPMQQFSRYKIGPRTRYIGQVLTRHLCSRYDPRIRAWWDDPTPENPEQVNADLQLDCNFGMITQAEYRAIRGRRPYTPEEEQKYVRLMGGKGADPQRREGELFGKPSSGAPGSPPVKRFEMNGRGHG